MIEYVARWMGYERRVAEPARAEARSMPSVGESLYSYLFGRSQITHAGVQVSEQGGLNFSAVFRSVQLIAGTASTLTCRAYETVSEDVRKPVPTLRIDRIMNDDPNPEMDGATMRETMFGHLLTWGNCYAEIVRNGAGEVIELYPLSPDLVTPKRTNDGKLVYEVRKSDGGTRTLSRDDVFHVPCFGYDGIVGYSPVAMARQTIGVGLAAEEFAARFYGDGTHIGGIIERPASTPWKDEAAKRFKSDFTAWHSGVGKSHRIAVLEDGMKYQKIGIPPNEAQFLETRKFTITEIARWYGIPPHMLYDLEQSTNNNIEHQGLEFLTYTLRYWLTKWERAVRRQLLTAAERERYYLEHITQGLVRADTVTRFEAYAKASGGAAFMSTNDIRRAENMPPVPGGDELLKPLNMSRVGDKPEKQPQDEGQTAA